MVGFSTENPRHLFDGEKKLHTALHDKHLTSAFSSDGDVISLVGS